MLNLTSASLDIQLAYIIKPYYLGNTEFLKYALYQVKKKLGDRPVNLYALRNTPVSIPPYYGLVDMIVDELNLPPDRILMHVRDKNFFHKGVTKIDYLPWDEKYRNVLTPYFQQTKIINQRSDAKRFGALFGRMQLGRILLAHHLETVHGNQSIVSFLADKNQLDHQIYNLENYFEDIKGWWHNRNNTEYSQTPDQDFGEYNVPDNILTYPEISQFFQVEIVVETDYCRLADYTEKTWRCLALAKPFILLCGPGTLAHLKELGFETFSPWIDESYDQIPDLMSRICAIQDEINRLATLDHNQWQQTITELDAIAERNAKIYSQWQYKSNLP
jgi:hypothetical protein